jgi:protein involved in polysaccharide export with SLBB domain
MVNAFTKQILKVFCIIGLALIAMLLIPSITKAQTFPQNINTVNADDLSESQVRQIMQQAKSSGLSDNDIVQAAENKGMAAPQAERLRQRITEMRRRDGNSVSTSASDTATRNSRILNYKQDSVRDRNTVSGAIPVFGADLFSSTSSTFEPNLKLATPVNYIIGPDDQLDVSVYGNSVVNWKLNVSPEGNINLPSGGIVNVAGKTIEAATAEIRSRLIAKNYAIGHGSTLKVTLGNIRSIKVIMVGELVRPGTYTLPSLATAFNALYSAGGPNDNGSFREIEIIRNNRVIRHLDIYSFLLNGSQKDNISLQDQDIIRVPAYQTRVEIAGEVKRHAYFEVLPGESMQDVIRFAGGFTSSAYRASVKVSQISDQQRRIVDVTETNFKNYVPLPGDIYTVSRILNRYENRVTINGSVFRPGEYQLQKNMTLLQLIQKAAGVKEDAFSGMGTITRLKPDNTLEIITFNLRDVLNKSVSYDLNREDVVTIRSIFDLRDQYTVRISGEVRSPGEFTYAENMTVESLIILANGLREGASPLRIEVARRVTAADSSGTNNQIAKVFTVDVDPQLTSNLKNFVLKPFDVIMVYKQPGYEKQALIRVEGEVTYPGPYVIQDKGEKISDIIKKAGGLTPSANPDGSTLRRHYIALLGVNKNTVDTATLAQEHTQRLNVIKRSFSDSTTTETDLRNNTIGINLKEILDKPGSTTDLVLKDGDVLIIPQAQQIVQVNGEVHVPSGIVYSKGNSFRQYVLDAGGYTSNAQRSEGYIIYPNGSVRGSHKFLFFNSHPNVKPGSEIFIPKKPLRRGISLAEFATILSAIGSIVILGILSSKR